MTTPSNALQAAIYQALRGNSTLSTLLGANTKIFDFVPEAATPPFVVIGDDTATDWGTKTNNGWDATITIHCWDFEAAGRKSVKSILSAIYAALNRQEDAITISGFTLVMLQFDFETTQKDPIDPQGDRCYHGIQRYRALIQD